MSRAFRFILAIALAWTQVPLAPAFSFAQSTDFQPLSFSSAANQSYQPSLLQGVRLIPDQPLQMDFFLTAGDEALDQEGFKERGDVFIKYFLAALTVPDDELWVNLSPGGENRIISAAFGQTRMGQDLLAQDYALKQLASAMMNPKHDSGRAFWERVYSQAGRDYGTSELPVNALSRIWIVPDRAVVYENGSSAFIADMHLEVKYENELEGDVRFSAKQGTDSRDDYSVVDEVLRELIIPEIEREVNEGRLFSGVRQMYSALVLSAWYKKRLRQSFLGVGYVDRRKTVGVEGANPDAKEEVYERYLQAFRQGLYQHVKEEYDPVRQQIVPRKYFTGGAAWDPAQLVVRGDTGAAQAATARLARSGSGARIGVDYSTLSGGDHANDRMSRSQLAFQDGFLTQIPLARDLAVSTDGGLQLRTINHVDTVFEFTEQGLLQLQVNGGSPIILNPRQFKGIIPAGERAAGADRLADIAGRLKSSIEAGRTMLVVLTDQDGNLIENTTDGVLAPISVPLDEQQSSIEALEEFRQLLDEIGIPVEIASDGSETLIFGGFRSINGEKLLGAMNDGEVTTHVRQAYREILERANEMEDEEANLLVSTINRLLWDHWIKQRQNPDMVMRSFPDNPEILNAMRKIEGIGNEGINKLKEQALETFRQFPGVLEGEKKLTIHTIAGARSGGGVAEMRPDTVVVMKALAEEMGLDFEVVWLTMDSSQPWHKVWEMVFTQLQANKGRDYTDLQKIVEQISTLLSFERLEQEVGESLRDEDTYNVFWADDHQPWGMGLLMRQLYDHVNVVNRIHVDSTSPHPAVAGRGLDYVFGRLEKFPILKQYVERRLDREDPEDKKMDGMMFHTLENALGMFGISTENFQRERDEVSQSNPDLLPDELDQLAVSELAGIPITISGAALKVHAEKNVRYANEVYEAGRNWLENMFGLPSDAPLAVEISRPDPQKGPLEFFVAAAKTMQRLEEFRRNAGEYMDRITTLSLESEATANLNTEIREWMERTLGAQADFNFDEQKLGDESYWRDLRDTIQRLDARAVSKLTVQYVYAGNIAADRADAHVMIENLRSFIGQLPQSYREKIHLLILPDQEGTLTPTDEVIEKIVEHHRGDGFTREYLEKLSSGDWNQFLVNTLQATAALGVQLSWLEGFGLTVTELLWKANFGSVNTVFVANDVGGIKKQMRFGPDDTLVGIPITVDPDSMLLAVGEEGYYTLLDKGDQRLTPQLVGENPHTDRVADAFVRAHLMSIGEVQRMAELAHKSALRFNTLANIGKILSTVERGQQQHGAGETASNNPGSNGSDAADNASLAGTREVGGILFDPNQIDLEIRQMAWEGTFAHEGAYVFRDVFDNIVGLEPKILNVQLLTPQAMPGLLNP